MARLARRSVPGCADFCLVHLVTRAAIVAVAGAHVTRDGDRLLRTLMRSYHIALDDPASGAASVVRTGRPLLRTAIQIDAAVVRRGDGRVVDLHRQLAPRSALVVPIPTPLGVVGALTLCYSESGRTYEAGDLASADRIAEQIARALLPAPPAVIAPAAAARHTRQGTTLRRRTAPPH